MKSNLPFNARPTTSPAADPGIVFKGSASNSAAVYRSLELPLPMSAPSPLSFAMGKSPSADFPSGLKGPQTKTKGDAVWNMEPLKTQLAPPAPGLFAFSPSAFQMKPSGDAAQLINLALRHLAVDVHNQDGFTWTCSVFDNFVETVFVLRLFNTRMVDVQRERGCPCTFAAVVAKLRAELSEVTDAAGPPKPVRMFAPPALPAELASAEDAADEQPVLNMCASQCVDVQREGAVKLARLLRMDATRCRATCGARLASLLSATQDGAARRLLVGAMGELTCDQLGAMKEADVRALIALLVNEQEPVETRRCAGKAVARLAQVNACASLVKSHAGSVSQAQIMCTDAQLGAILQDVNRAVSAS